MWTSRILKKKLNFYTSIFAIKRPVELKILASRRIIVLQKGGWPTPPKVIFGQLFDPTISDVFFLRSSFLKFVLASILFKINVTKISRKHNLMIVWSIVFNCQICIITTLSSWCCCRSFLKPLNSVTTPLGHSVDSLAIDLFKISFCDLLVELFSNNAETDTTWTWIWWPCGRARKLYTRYH